MANETTPALKWFMEQLVAMEPNTENSGTYANKPGYHNTRKANRASDYSVRHPLDRLGPDDKAAAGDWTHRAAQNGDYTSMLKYGRRLLAAFNARDPRLWGWAEAQGQVDADASPEELNFGPDWTRGTPSPTHAWHWHFSVRRGCVESRDNMEAMLSVLRGESLADYLARGGKLMGEDDMSWTENLTGGKDAGSQSIPAKDWLIGTNVAAWRTVQAVASLTAMVEAIAKKVDLEPAELDAVKAAAAAGVLAAVPGLTDAIVEALQEETGLDPLEAEAAAERAMRRVLGQLDNPAKTTT